ncbi:DNA-binding response regulator [Pigmentiphaga sp. NML080357]|uniref:response regulator n=1 Tax=Pigmentiphaga sp. NML080357 TaxID=2008675 RepID=UPI000B41B60B|nr:response regulator transcription factor [Pigmentiphaga sp. NML080357]OVZ60337.1 DNA-binding response regulator [Pigmentiphaga sp. NML080357]
MRLNILVVDDHMIIRRGLARLLGEDPRIARVDEAADGPSALRALRRGAYHAMVLDIALGERDGLDVLKSVRGEFPMLGVVMLSVYPESQLAVRALRSGAHAYLNKGCEPDDLLAALASAAAGKSYVTPAVAELLASTVRQDRPQAPHELLSNREFQVLQLLVAGKSVSAIGEHLVLSANTISTYRGRIFEKLGVRSIAELVAYARAHGLHLI